ncbi:MAG: hypothetical protein ACREI3_05590, partial [Nitrospirales bacterium]
MKTSHRHITVLWFSMWLLGGCAYGFSDHKTLGTQPDQPTSNQTSFVFGYIDMQDADPGLDWVTFQQLAPVAKDPDIPGRARDGIFYLENVALGSYQVYDFGGRGGGFFAKGNLYATYPVSFPVSRQSGFMRVKVEKPGVYFLGSYKYVSVKGSRFTTSYVYDLEPLKTPTEREVLE